MLFDKKFDLIFSLGEACSCTQSLRDSKLQLYSYPFDWLYGSDFLGRIDILLNEFKRFIDKGDLVYSHNERSINCNAYTSSFNGITFNHDFLASVDFDEMYELVNAKYNRRIKRLLSQITRAKKILLVYIETPNNPNKLQNNSILIESLQRIKAKYPNKQLSLLYFSNDSKMKALHYKEENLSSDVIKVMGNYWHNGGGGLNFLVEAKFFKLYFKDYSINISILYRFKKLFLKIFRKITNKKFKKQFISDNLPTKKPLVSVIIPAYNHQNYIQETIKSIINQTYENIECIIIDDGSSDKTWQKIQEMQEKLKKRFARVIAQTKRNEGTCATLNKMLDLAQGEFIYLIASDDIAKPQAIEKEVDFLLKHEDYALIVGDNELIDSTSKVCYWDYERNIVYDRDNADFKTFAEFLQYNNKIDFETDEFGRYDKLYLTNHIPNGYLVRQAIFNKIGKFTNEAPLEDWWLMLQIAKYAKMKFLNEILYSYRWHDSNTIKDREKMDNFSKKVKVYENYLLNDIDKSEVLPIVFAITTNGYLYKTIGIPYILVLEKYMLVNNGGGGGSEKLLSYLISLSLAGQNNSHLFIITSSKSWEIPNAF